MLHAEIECEVHPLRASPSYSLLTSGQAALGFLAGRCRFNSSLCTVCVDQSSSWC